MTDQATPVADTDTLPPSTLVGGPGQPITSEQYQFAMDMLVAAFRPVQFIDVAALREHWSKADTLAPMLDPTTWHRKGGRERLQDQADILTAAEAVAKALAAIKARHPELTS